MSEIVKYFDEQVTIGSCENLYYVSYGKYIATLRAGFLRFQEGNLPPEKYVLPGSGFRFRFPFPDEDHLPFADHRVDDRRGLTVILDRTGFLDNLRFPGPKQTDGVTNGLNPNNSGSAVTLEIVQQELIGRLPDIRLVVVLRDPYSTNVFGLDQLDEVEFLIDQITKHHLKKVRTVGDFRFWTTVIKRIRQGYLSDPAADPE